MGHDGADALEDRGLRVGAPDLLQSEHDLALRAVRAGGLHETRHEVPAVLARRFLERRERRLDPAGVARALDELQALDLLALEPRVRLVERQLVVVVAFAEPRDPDEMALAVLELALEPEGGVGDLALREAALHGLHHP